MWHLFLVNLNPKTMRMETKPDEIRQKAWKDISLLLLREEKG